MGPIPTVTREVPFVLTRETRLKMALELTRLVMDLKENADGSASREWQSDQLLDVFEACYQRMEELELEVEAQPGPVIPAD